MAARKGPRLYHTEMIQGYHLLHQLTHFTHELEPVTLLFCLCGFFFLCFLGLFGFVFLWFCVSVFWLFLVCWFFLFRFALW